MAVHAASQFIRIADRDVTAVANALSGTIQEIIHAPA
jgi:hypothetical protein